MILINLSPRRRLPEPGREATGVSHRGADGRARWPKPQCRPRLRSRMVPPQGALFGAGTEASVGPGPDHSLGGALLRGGTEGWVSGPGPGGRVGGARPGGGTDGPLKHLPRGGSSLRR